MTSLKTLSGDIVFQYAHLYELDNENLVAMVTNAMVDSHSYENRLNDLYKPLLPEEIHEISLGLIIIANKYSVPQLKGKKNYESNYLKIENQILLNLK